jgi:outer membrane lipoprotein-sorting protein
VTKTHRLPPASRRKFLAGAAALSLLPLLSAGIARAAAPAAVALTDQDIADLTRIEAYLNGISTLRANFQQYTNTGGLAYGRIYLRRPGRLRVEYDPPVQALIVADGIVVSYYDGELDQVTQAPIGSSPLWFLLRKDISLREGVAIAGIDRAPGVIRVRAFENDEPEAGQVTLVFADGPLQLKQGSILDAQGTEVRDGLQGVSLGGELPNELFATPSTRKLQDGR